MIKLKAALQYRLRYQLKYLGVFYLYFIFFAVIMAGIAIFLFNGTDSAQSELTLPALIFAIILSVIGIHSDFKLFLQNGMNRWHIFISNVMTNFVMSHVIVLTMVFFRLMLKTFLSHHFDYMFIILDLYQPKTLLSQYLLLFLVIFWGMVLGLVVGLFFDCFSFVTRLLIGAGIILLPFLFGTVFTTLSAASQHQVLANLAHILGLSNDGLNVIPLMTTLFILIFVNLILSYFMNRHRELQRIH